MAVRALRIGQILLSATAVLAVVLGSSVGAVAWRGGQHASVDQLNLHLVYEALGWHDHHGHADASREADSASPAVLQLALAFDVFSPTGGASPTDTSAAIESVALVLIATRAPVATGFDPRVGHGAGAPDSPPPRSLA
ncbi:MAG: hypothetical protein U0821_12460 [Chloroflexota bacterium]